MSFSNKQYFFSIGSDQCILANPQFTCFIAIYVDDILFLAPEDAVIQSVVNNLEKEFKIKDLGHVNNLLGMKIIQKKGKITISQVNYVIKLLEEFNMLDCKPKSTPMDNSTQFSCLQSPNSEQEKSKMATKPYRSLIGKLHYLASHSRPDITFAVSLLSRYNNNPGPCHWKGAKRILRYLRGTVDYCLVLKPQNLNLIGFCDADWGSQEDRKSTTGIVFSIGGGLIAWRCKKQQTVALSSMEAEYQAIALAVQELCWIASICKELKMVSDCPVINEDNQACMY